MTIFKELVILFQVDRQLDTRDNRKRILAENLKLKEYLAEVEKCLKVMRKMSKEMENHDYDKIDREKRKISEHVSQLVREDIEGKARLGKYSLSILITSLLEIHRIPF